ncbi:MAG: antitoxin family protein [Fimbriimonadales bacterium]|nr:antitoxin family protein [Fimbriimonadales bacterium]
MATLTIEAVYERGVLRPLRPLELPEHTRVRLTVEPTPTHPLTDCLGIMPDEDAAEMRRIIEQEFEWGSGNIRYNLMYGSAAR